jgi:pimeloyl-ACP methyl ester carboxylesterase
MIEPFFFRDEQAVGFYHPASDPNSSRLLVICPPLFDDYRRSFRALSELAIACADQGVHVLRFDFFGTGESHGLLEEVTLDDWKEDIRAAIDEGIELTGADQVDLLGVRFGATLAAQSRHSKITRYIFWDPVISGNTYLEFLNHVNLAIELRHKKLAMEENLAFEKIPYETFFLSAALRQDISHIFIDPQERESSAPYFVISTNKAARALGFAHYEFAGIDYDWPDYHVGVLSQKTVLEAIVRRVIEP